MSETGIASSHHCVVKFFMLDWTSDQFVRLFVCLHAFTISVLDRVLHYSLCRSNLELVYAQVYLFVDFEKRDC